jgi:hypothetical protein
LGYIVARQRKMLCCKMSLQLSWNHIIAAKFFFTRKTRMNRTCCVTTPEKPERQIIHITDTLFLVSFFAGSLLSLPVLTLLCKIYPVMNLSVMQIIVQVCHGQWKGVNSRIFDQHCSHFSFQ